MTSHAMPISAVSSLRNSATTLSRSLKVGTTTDNCGVAAACDEVPCPGRMASFMRQRISPGAGDAKARRPAKRWGRLKTGRNDPQNANDHEQQARVHPALPYYSVVVPAPELSSIDGAVVGYVGAINAFRKGYQMAGKSGHIYIGI